MVAWIVRALLSHSVEEYVLAIGGSNPIEYSVLIAQLSKDYVTIPIAERRVQVKLGL